MSPEATDESPPICDYEGSDYQTTFWDQGDRQYEDQVEAVALRRLLPLGGDMLLEVGAGAGRNTPRYTGFSRLVLLDYSRTQLQQAQSRLKSDPRLLFVVADAYRLPFEPGLFDTLTMIRVLHHMAEPTRALDEVRRVLQPQGVLVLEFASKRHLKSILRFILGQQDWSPFTMEPVEFAPLNFDFHPAAVRAWLREANLAVQRQLTVSHFRLPLLKRWVPLRLLVAMDSLAQWTGDLWQLTPSVFVQAVAAGRGLQPAPGAFFRCPACHLPLTGVDPWSGPAPTEGQHTCPQCRHPWTYQGGIYQFK